MGKEIINKIINALDELGYKLSYFKECIVDSPFPYQFDFKFESKNHSSNNVLIKIIKVFDSLDYNVLNIIKDYPKIITLKITPKEYNNLKSGS